MEQRKNDEVILERIDNLKSIVMQNHEENTEYHKISNGRLKKHDDWINRLIGIWAVGTTIVIPLLVYIFSDVRRDMYDIEARLEKKITTQIELNNNKFFEQE